MIRLSTPLYVIQSNAKNDLYLSFTNKKYLYTKQIEVAQHTLEYAFYFQSETDAKRFLLSYFNTMGDSIKEQNKKYYKVKEMNYSLDSINCNIFMFGVPCYFSKSRFDQWSSDPDKYKYIFK